jgi:hypothetical protein
MADRRERNVVDATNVFDLSRFIPYLPDAISNTVQPLHCTYFPLIRLYLHNRKGSRFWQLWFYYHNRIWGECTLFTQMLVITQYVIKQYVASQVAVRQCLPIHYWIQNSNYTRDKIPLILRSHRDVSVTFRNESTELNVHVRNTGT